MAIQVITDSTCDMPEGLADELGIRVVPIYLRFGDKTYRDGVDITKDEFYSMISHELRTPLAIVTSSLENLEHEPLNEAWNVATSTLTAIMGRISSYTGKLVRWKDLTENTSSPWYNLTLKPTAMLPEASMAASPIQRWSESGA